MPLLPLTASAQEASSLTIVDERPSRPFFATCRASVTAAASTAKAKTNGGRWCLNAGSEMTMQVEGINMAMGPYGPRPQPIRCVVDLASAKFDKPVIPCFSDHYESMYAAVGNWSDGEVDDTGIFASLNAYAPRDDREAQAMGTAILVKALMDQGHPWEASIGAYSDDGEDGFEEVDAGETVKINGRVYAGGGDLPLFVMRNARISEASVVMYGADSNTGRVAAARHTSKETIMENLTITAERVKVLRAAHANHADVVLRELEAGKTDQEIALAVAAAENATLKSENATLKAAADKKPAAAVVLAKADTGESKDAPGAGGSGNGNGGTFFEVRAQIQKENPKVKGLALNEMVYKARPDLRPGAK